MPARRPAGYDNQIFPGSRRVVSLLVCGGAGMCRAAASRSWCWPGAPILPVVAVVAWTCRKAVSAAMRTEALAACQAG